jgi:hypothetical protein
MGANERDELVKLEDDIRYDLEQNFTEVRKLYHNKYGLDLQDINAAIKNVLLEMVMTDMRNEANRLEHEEQDKEHREFLKTLEEKS